MKKLIYAACCALAWGMGSAQAQVGNGLQASEVEQEGILERVDPTRYTVRISGKTYQLDQTTKIYVGTRRVYGLAELATGGPASFGTDGQGRVTALLVLDGRILGSGGTR
ncbi:MAG: hypothetical protein KDG55_07810 [Rhodocyclaceae bacterium]|nr:hypothetical protein [Rhodocyclaceae bacterium]